MGRRILETSFWTESRISRLGTEGFDLCMLSNRTNNTVESIMSIVIEIEAKARGEELLPMRCRAGNSWPSKGEFCSSEDIPFAHRKNLQRAIIGYDDPSSQPLRDFSKDSRMNVVPYFLSETVLCNNFTGPRRVNWKEGIWRDPVSIPGYRLY